MNRAAPLLGLLLLPGVLAALEISPDSIRVEVESGGKVRASTVMVNDSSAPVRVSAAVVPEGDLPSDWLRLSRTEMRLAPGKRREVSLSGRIPGDLAEWKGHLVFRMTRPGQESWYEARVLRPVLVRVPSAERCEAVLQASVRREERDILVEGILRNTGNVHLRPRLQVTLDGVSGGAPLTGRQAPEQALMPGRSLPFLFRLPAREEDLEGEVSAFFPDPAGNIQSVRSHLRTPTRGAPR